MTQLLQLSLWLMRRRLRRAWALSAVAALGILSAVTLLAAAALYSQALAEAGLRHALFSRPAAAHHVQALVQNRPLGPADYAQLRGIVETAAQHRLGNLAAGQERFGRVQTGMALSTDPAPRPPPPGAPAGRPFFMTGFAEHSRILEGHWPQRTGTAGPGGVELDAVVGRRVANDMGYAPGSRLYITPFRGAPQERITLNIVGIAEPVNPRDEYWLGYPSQFSVQTVGDALVVPVYVTETDFRQVLGRRFPTASGDFGFNLFVDPAQIAAGDVASTQDALRGLEADLNKAYPRTFVFSRLGLTLREFQRDLTLARVPVYVFISLAVIVTLYFLALTGGMLGRSQATEIGLLRGRGAGVAQVCGGLLTAEALLALAAAAVGPPLAWLAVRHLLLPALWDSGDAADGGGAVAVALSGDAFWLGAAGAALALATLAASLAGRARTGMADAAAARSRPPTVSPFHRYYLDLPALAAVALVWWQFRERDGFVSRALASRGLDIDPALILAPALGLLAAALLLMRALPLLLRLAAWLGMRWGPGWSPLAIAPLARDPALPVSVAALLMLCAALGVFGAAFQSTLSQSQSDQAKYNVGGEIVISGPGASAALSAQLAAMPEVKAATPVLRDSVRLAQGHGDLSASLIAAAPDALAQTAWFRADFAAAPLPELTARLQPARDNTPGQSPGPSIPPGADRIGVWLQTADLESRQLQAAINVWARLTDGAGRYRNISLGGFGGPGRVSSNPPQNAGRNDRAGWRFFDGDLPARMVESGQEWHLTAIFFSTSSFVKVAAGRIAIDDFTVFGPSLPDTGMAVESFDAPGQWTPIATAAGIPDRLATIPGAAGLAFSWDAPFGGEQRGIHRPPAPLPLPAIGGPGLQPGQHVRIRHGRAAIPVVVTGASQLFPTVTDFRQPFLLLDLESYLSYLRFLPPGNAETAAQEVWLALNPAYDRQSALDAVTAELPPLVTIASRDNAAAIAARNPLAGRGWNGLTALGLTAMGLAATTALLLHSAASARARRTDTAVAQAMGLSRRQLFLSLTAERWLPGGAALAAGAALGYWPGLELAQLLAVTPTGAAPVPPMLPQVNALLLTAALAGLSAAVMASAALGAALARRDRPVDALRAGA